MSNDGFETSPYLRRLAALVQDQRIVAMTVLGFLSGILCALVEFSPDSVSRLIPGEDVNIVGVIFGIVIGLYLYRLRLASATKAVLFLVASGLAWLSAYYFAGDVAWDYAGEVCQEDWCRFMLAGIPAGLLGAGLLVAAICFLFPFFRRTRLVVATIVVGGLAGALLGFENVFVLFPLWQGAIAYCFARGFPTAISPRGEEFDTA